MDIPVRLITTLLSQKTVLSSNRLIVNQVLNNRLTISLVSNKITTIGKLTKSSYKGVVQMSQNRPLNLRKMVFISLFTALIIIGSYISFPLPLTPTPIVLADFFVMLTGLSLGAAGAAASVGLYLFLGALGLPVFAGGSGGIAPFLGPTGGFLFGYLLGAIGLGLISGKGKASFIKDLLALIVFSAILFGIGVPWLKLVLKVTWDKALAFGLFPFIIGNIVKIIAAFSLIQVLRPSLKQIIPNSTSKV
jgi:biotin transport system substrate-specific component